MSALVKTPQTLTVMEACFTLNPGVDEEFWRAQDKFGPVAERSPGFRAVIGGPIANSPWLYFCGKWETPDLMDQWYHTRAHTAVQNKAHEKWFKSVYIRKWRLPQAGEEITGRVFSEIAIARQDPLPDGEVESLLSTLNTTLPVFGPRPFETVIGEYEDNPYQFVGPLQETPAPAPVRYLLLTHWDSLQALRAWLDSSSMAAIRQAGEVTCEHYVPIFHAPGERDRLTPDGFQRGWGSEQR